MAIRIAVIAERNAAEARMKISSTIRESHSIRSRSVVPVAGDSSAIFDRWSSVSKAKTVYRLGRSGAAEKSARACKRANRHVIQWHRVRDSGMAGCKPWAETRDSDRTPALRLAIAARMLN